MGWFIALAVIVLLLWYPLRIRVQVSCHNTIKAALYWQPLPFLKKRPKIKLYAATTKNPLAAETASPDEAENAEQEKPKSTVETPPKKAKKTKAAKKPKKEAKKKNGFDWKALAKRLPWKKMLDEALKTGHLEELKLHLVLVGNPAYACLGGGFLWANLGFGLGVLSTKLKRFPAKPNLNIVWREKGFEAEAELLLMVRLGSGIRLGIYLLYIILKERKRCKNEGRQSNRRFAEYSNGKPA